MKPPEPNLPKPNKLLYYLLLGFGFAGLLGWFYLMRQLGLMEWLAQLGPETHKGSLNLLAIMLWMIPALLLWKYYLRWLNRRFELGGQYDQDRHDAMYQNDSQPRNSRDDSPPQDDKAASSMENNSPKQSSTQADTPSNSQQDHR